MTVPRPPRRSAGWAALATACLALAGCTNGPASPGSARPAAASTTAPATTPPKTSMTIVTLEYQFTGGAATVAAGPVPIVLRNLGQEQHNAQLIRLNDGVDPERVAAALGEDPDGAGLLELGDMAGGPGPVDPGGSRQATQSLTPGRYLVVCTVRGRAGEVHAADGMIASFDVVAGTASAAPAPPATRLRLTDFGIDLPDRLPRRGLVEVVNQGKVPHEVAIYRLPSRQSAGEAVRRYVRSLRGTKLHEPPPFPAFGGVAAIAPGATARFNLDLEPGEYVAICLVPGAKGSHAVLGMVTRFRV